MAKRTLEVVITGDSKDAQKALADLGYSVQEAEKKTESSLSKMNDKLGKAGTAAGLAAGAALTKGLFDTLSAESGNDRVAASLGLTEAQSAMAGEAAGNLYSSAFGGSMEEVQTAIAAVGSSLVDMNTVGQGELQLLTATALNFAEAFAVDVDRSVSNAQILLKTGLAGSATEAFDLMTVAYQKTPIAQRDELTDATQEYSQFFAQIGYDGAAMFSALTAVAPLGQYAIDKTGDAIKEFSIRATDGSTATVDAMTAIGLNAGEMSNMILAGGDSAQFATGMITKALQGVKDPTAQAAAAIALFGTPLEDLGTDKIPQFLAALDPMSNTLGTVEGAAGKMGATLNDNTGTRLEEFKRKFETAFMEQAERAIPLLEKLTENFDLVFPAVVAITGALIAYKAAMIAWEVGSKVVMAAQKIWTGIQWAFNAAMSANPIGLVIAAIAALVAGIVWAYQNVDWFRDAVDKAWDVLQDAFEFLLLGATTTWEGIAAGAQWLWSSVLQPIWTAIQWYIQNVLIVQFNMLKSVVSVVWNTISDAVSNAWSRMSTIIGWMVTGWGWVSSAVSGTANFIMEAFRTAFNWVANAWNSTVGALSFSIPSWVPGVGGKGWDVPNIPTFHSGGVFRAPTPGGEGLALLRDGERVLTPEQANSGVTIVVQGSVIAERDLAAMVHRFSQRGGRMAGAGV